MTNINGSEEKRKDIFLEHISKKTDDSFTKWLFPPGAMFLYRLKDLDDVLES